MLGNVDIVLIVILFSVITIPVFAEDLPTLTNTGGLDIGIQINYLERWAYGDFDIAAMNITLTNNHNEEICPRGT